jgi:hypothetical protein
LNDHNLPANLLSQFKANCLSPGLCICFLKSYQGLASLITGYLLLAPAGASSKKQRSEEAVISLLSGHDQKNSAPEERKEYSQGWSEAEPLVQHAKCEEPLPGERKIFFSSFPNPEISCIEFPLDGRI